MRQVYILDELKDAADLRRSVIVPKSFAFNRPRPAAFIINLPGAILYQLFCLGMYVYEKETKSADSKEAERESAAAEDRERA